MCNLNALLTALSFVASLKIRELQSLCPILILLTDALHFQKSLHPPALELASYSTKVKPVAPNLHRISHQTVKALSDSSKRKVFVLYNAIVSKGNIPNSWKLAVTVPIPKNKNSSVGRDYHPISLRCCLSKLMEKIATSTLSWCLD